MTNCIGGTSSPFSAAGADLPVVAVTLKNRTLSPTVELFLECGREVIRSLAVVPEALTRAGSAGKRGN